jgi:branched-chain amino acid transport system permease protein
VVLQLIVAQRTKPIWTKGIQAGLIATALVFPWVFPAPFIQRMAIIIFIYATLASAWNILGGFAGQASLGHAAYFGLGAYASSLLVIKAGLNPWLAMFAGATAVSLFGLTLGLLMFRIAPWYFTVTTIALGELTYTIFLNTDYVGGARGLFLPLLKESWRNLTFSSKVPFYYVTLILMSCTVLVAYILERSRAGYYFKAIRDDAIAASSLGVEVYGYKILALIISAFFTSLAGSIYAQYVMYIDPDSTLLLSQSIQIVLVVALGGIGTIWGPVIGAMLLMPLAELTRVYLSGLGRALDLMLYSVLLLGIAVWQPGGLLGLGKYFRRKPE